MRTFQRLLFGAALASTSCASGPAPSTVSTFSGSGSGSGSAAPEAQSAFDRELAARAPTRLAASDATRAIDAAITSYFQRAATQRGYVMTDKPLYQPGETIWFRADVRATGSLRGVQRGLTMRLVSPRGAIAAEQRVLATDGVASSAFDLPAELDGGEYTLQMTSDDGTVDGRKIIVNTYEAPRLAKTLELLRKAYGEGDPVAAALEIKRATGEPFAHQAVTGVVTVDDVEVARLAIQTDGAGKATARFQLPAHIARGDGLLTILASDGGVTESIQKRIPIVMKTMQVELFPEGGDLVEGLPGRVYVAAQTPLGKPADVSGRVVDEHGAVVGEFTTIHDGLGKFELQPQTDHSYHVEITRPTGIAQTFALPAAKPAGCVLRSVAASRPDVVRVAALCTTARTLEVEAVLREARVASGALQVAAGAPSVIELAVDAAAQGAVRVTLFSTKHEPLAERLVYHGRGQDLKVTLSADKTTYAPRDPVKLTVRTTDAAGKPVKASLGVAVVDGSVLAFADDKSANVLAHLFLEPELGATGPGARPIEEPNFYLSDQPDAPAALDALLATRGYRRFEWQPVFAPPPPPAELTAATAADEEEADGRIERAAPRPAMPKAAMQKAAMPRRAMAVPMAPPPPPGALAVGKPAKHKLAMPAGMAQPAPRDAPRAEPVLAEEAKAERPRRAHAEKRPGNAQLAMADRRRDDGDDLALDKNIVGWAPVRVFPVPAYERPYDGPRTDFRETIFWNGNVQTGADGTAQVAFVTSDAITAFHATAEGVSAAGVAGRGALDLTSRLPLTLDAHLPVEVTQGDELRLPVTVSNDSDHALDAELAATFGAAFKLGPAPARKIHVAPHAKLSVFYPLRVVATDGNADVDLALTTGGLKDEIKKQIRVVPLGFPFEVSAAGTAKRGAPTRHTFDLTGALPGSLRATITMYPSPLAALTTGMAAMIREPGGCFEQTSSTNYPNIMILGYLNANDAADPALIEKTHGTLDRGYKLLTGYETTQKGYEWFGKSPGHEALTAYGLMEFADMAKVYDVDPKMVERTADWLMSRRDHKGGFQRSHEALDSFGRASEATTNAYIVWALANARRTAGLDGELAAQQALGATTKDPYLLALATSTATLSRPGAGETHAMVDRLAGLQGKDGAWPGAKESITMSGGESLVIETTALATIALIQASPNHEFEPQIRRAVDWLNTKRGGYGQWGNTQATVLGLKALTAYADHARQMASAGSATLLVNGKPAGTIAFDQGRKDALVWDDVADKLAAGQNTIELQLTGDAQLPYSIALDYRAARPPSSPEAKIALTTQLDRREVALGEGVKLRAHVENTTAGGVPMTLARIGVPGGLAFQTWQLKELRDKGAIDFYETRPREVILYWRALAPAAKKDIALDLLATVPGHYEAPASSAYLYYTAEDKAWAPAVTVDVK
ncbi:MAG TPA: MG2 domain-containing protein [Kofleriaceae bacterium]|nr:MG2 domain-containing protein [Kofleriaceae bacterium]